MRQILESIRDVVQGKILVDVTVPLNAARTFVPCMCPKEKRPAWKLRRCWATGVRVVAAFQNVSAVHLQDLTHSVNCDVLVCGDDDEAKARSVPVGRSD